MTSDDFADWLSIDPNLLTVENDPDNPRSPRWVKNTTGVVLIDLRAAEGRSAIQWIPKVPGVPGPSRYAPMAGRERRPVVGVTWDGARLYCEAKGKRLPTEAEWEAAARGATARRYPWGDGEPPCDAVVFGRDAEGRCHALPAEPQDVATGSLDETPEGIHGLAGNVSEWVFDAFETPYYGLCGACQDPAVEHAGAGPDLRILRGGSWGSTILMRTTTRGRWQRTTGSDSLGFRCAAQAMKP